MVPSSTDDPAGRAAGPRPSGSSPARAVAAVLERSRFLVALGALTSVGLGAGSFVWAAVKAGRFVDALLAGGAKEDAALLKLFESIDTILIGTVLLAIGLGLWELFVSDLHLPASLTTSSFDDLKAKVATTLLLVLVVRFLETFVGSTDSRAVLELGIAVTLVGGLLLVFARWKPS